MLRVSKLTDYATVILSVIAKDHLRAHTTSELADVTGIALPMTSKILKLLVKSRVLTSTRGAKGGYTLADVPENITIAAVINALEGPIALTECSVSRQCCEQASGCNIHTNWRVINRTIHNALASVTLADLLLPATPEPVIIPVANLFR